MNMRERIADWISGGAVMRAKDAEAFANEHMSLGYYGLKDAMNRMESKYSILEYDNRNGWANSDRFQAALTAIAACETPSANATVRRMANIAREALK